MAGDQDRERDRTHSHDDERTRRADVRDTYDRIATHFASTREYAWPEVEAFVDAHATDRTGVGLDLGCGNCRHAELLEPRLETVVGLDVSRGLLETGRKRALERDFDVELVQGTRRRSRWPTTASISRSTLRRCITCRRGRPAGRVWTTSRGYSPRRPRAGQRVVDRPRPVRGNRGVDTTVEWTLPGGEAVDRFYHIYAPDEFEADLAESDLEVLEWELSSGNCYATVAGTGTTE